MRTQKVIATPTQTLRNRDRSGAVVTRGRLVPHWVFTAPALAFVVSFLVNVAPF